MTNPTYSMLAAKGSIKISLELAAMLDRPRIGPTKPVNRKDDQYWAIDTLRQLKLCKAANRILRKAKFFTRHKDEFDALPADCIAADHLRPLWHGTV